MTLGPSNVGFAPFLKFDQEPTSQPTPQSISPEAPCMGHSRPDSRAVAYIVLERVTQSTPCVSRA